jgi:hypothetical protein
MSLPVWLWWHKLPINCRELNDSNRCKAEGLQQAASVWFQSFT